CSRCAGSGAFALPDAPGPASDHIQGSSMFNVTLKRFEVPDKVLHFPKGRFEIFDFGGPTIGRAIHEPGYKWSVDNAPIVGTSRSHLEHLGLVLQGRATTAFDDGRAWELTPGTLFHIPPEPHDLWVVGSEPYVTVHFLGEGYYSK